jgi:hypothetical protein
MAAEEPQVIPVTEIDQQADTLILAIMVWDKVLAPAVIEAEKVML